MLSKFTSVYPEFKELLSNEDYICSFYNLIDKVKCVTYRYKCINDLHLHKCKMYEFFTLAAHYVIVNNILPGAAAFSPGIGGGGVVTSASLGDASVSYDTNLDKAMIGNSPYKAFLYTTSYGKEYIAMLDRNTGLLTIN